MIGLGMIFGIDVLRRQEIFTNEMIFDSQLIRESPRCAVARVSRGYLWAMANKYDSALVDLQEAVRLEPRNVSARSNLGNLMALRGHPDSALTQYDIGLSLAPGSDDLWMNRGNVLNTLGKSREALESYARAQAAGSRSHDLHLYRGMAYTSLGLNDSAQAEFEHSLELYPTDVRVMVELAGNFTARGVIDKATLWIDRALSRDRSSQRAWYFRGLIAIQQERWNDALTALDNAIKFSTNFRDAYVQRSKVLQKLGRIDEAQRDMEKSKDAR